MKRFFLLSLIALAFLFVGCTETSNTIVSPDSPEEQQSTVLVHDKDMGVSIRVVGDLPVAEEGVSTRSTYPTTYTSVYIKSLSTQFAWMNKNFLSRGGSNVDLYSHDDGSNNQRWMLFPISNSSYYHVLNLGAYYAGQANCWLSVTADGTNVDLYTHDDGSGRQRWYFYDAPLNTIKVEGGVSHARLYLSRWYEHVDTWSSMGDNQKFRVE